ncbi:MAG: hypothetical protein C0623_11135 [Desulfuromonas sp.]|nr:MAG: hypothetical protein C0623_11135 [Desulfuromonas sp.]
MNLEIIPYHLKALNLTRAGPPAPRFWWHAGKPPDLTTNHNDNAIKQRTDMKKVNKKRRKEMKPRTMFRNITGIMISALFLSLIMAPTSALAATAAGTIITNTAYVDWNSNPNAGPVPATATVTVDKQPFGPTVLYDSTSPGTTISEGTDADITYTIRSQGNGTDIYDLTLGSAETGDLGAPTYLGTNPTTVDLGASMVLTAAAATDTITIAGLAADHGLAANETVYIGTTAYTINTVTENTTDSTVTLYDFGTTNAASVTVSVGDPVVEQRTLTFTMTAGTYSGATDGTHAMTLTAASQVDGASGSVNNPTITVTRATLTIDKSASPTSAAPGQDITYTITVENTSGATASGVTVTDSAPTFTTFKSAEWSIDGGATTAVTEAALAAGVNVGDLNASSILTVTLIVTVD